MARFSALPQELRLQISDSLELIDKIHLSATCKAYRTQLLPEIFKTICFTNDETSENSALAAVEAHGEYTTRIEFTCYAEADYELTTPALRLGASKILNGHLTPNLRTVQLKFDFDFDDGDWDDNPMANTGTSIYVFEEIEDEDYVRKAEQNWQWRALMKETWQALAANNYMRDLILDEFVPKWTSTFRTDEFRQFLSRLESATFNIFGADNGAGWSINTTWGYGDFLSTLDLSFLNHMSGLKLLHIKASDPLGLEGPFHIPLALKRMDLPVLESLKLENCFIGPELVSFIQGHAQVLRSLDIDRCFGAGDHSGLASNPMSWVTFFDNIYKAKPSLVELKVGGREVPLSSGEWMPSEASLDENLRGIIQKLGFNPKLKLFSYHYLDDKYGTDYEDWEEDVERFNSGDDQRAYERLMGLIEANATRT
ncbi:hypothetical protein V494_02093 [Pseudogymnoascus sp. VKM F-4513 (FW-928)]|nr:hypothetical protein V494_02093 [Pseudogymnoascus sp. VKM F-4513 (FW-928)]